MSSSSNVAGVMLGRIFPIISNDKCDSESIFAQANKKHKEYMNLYKTNKKDIAAELDSASLDTIRLYSKSFEEEHVPEAVANIAGLEMMDLAMYVMANPLMINSMRTYSTEGRPFDQGAQDKVIKEIVSKIKDKVDHVYSFVEYLQGIKEYTDLAEYYYAISEVFGLKDGKQDDTRMNTLLKLGNKYAVKYEDAMARYETAMAEGLQ